MVAAGFPVVATTSGGVASSLGYEDHEGAPGDEMLAVAARIARSVEVPVTVDAEAGYGLEPADLVAALSDAGVAGCNLEETDHANERIRDASEQADWLHRVREAAAAAEFPLVINARIDVFLGGADPQGDLVPDALERAAAYLAAGADCVYPIALRERDAVRTFVSQAGGPVNLLALPQAGPVAELAELGVARISWGSLLHRESIEQFQQRVSVLA